MRHAWWVVGMMATTLSTAMPGGRSGSEAWCTALNRGTTEQTVSVVVRAPVTDQTLEGPFTYRLQPGLSVRAVLRSAAPGVCWVSWDGATDAVRVEVGRTP